MIKYFFIFIYSVLILTNSSLGLCQEGEYLLKQVNELKEKSQNQDPLKENLNAAQNLKDEYYKKNLEISESKADMLRSLKNPFITQLPQKNVEEKKKEKKKKNKVHLNKQKEDPLNSATSKIKSKPAFQISGLVWNTKIPQAIINDQVVAVGDTIDEWTIIDIKEEGVEVSSESQTFFLEP